MKRIGGGLENPKSSPAALRARLLASFAMLPACLPQSPEADWFPAVDYCEREREYVLYVDLPGLDSGAVRIGVGDGVLSISGRRNAPSAVGKFLRAERPRGRFQRLLPLPENVRPDQIQASFQHGTLTLLVPKDWDATPGAGETDFRDGRAKEHPNEHALTQNGMST